LLLTGKRVFTFVVFRLIAGVVEGVPQVVAQDLGFGALAARALIATPPPPPSLCISR